MASKRETILAAVLVLVKTALPNANVKRNAAKPASPSPGGDVFLRDGDPGSPDVDLSPLTYNYTHEIPLEIAGFASQTLTKEQVIDQMFGLIGVAIEQDRTLGGLCMFMEPRAPTSDDLETTGSVAGLWADAAIIVQYATQNPLT